MPVIRHLSTRVEKRQKRVRAKMLGTKTKPRLTVFRSNKNMYLQAVDDESGKTLVSAHSKQVQDGKKAATKTEDAVVLAKKLADDLKKKKINTLVFDRGANKYHGRVKAIAETLRAEGITI